MNMSVTALDIVVVLLILLSAGYAAWRGFLSETLTIFDWAAAAFGCLYFGPYLVPMMQGLVATSWIATLLAYAVVFLIIFIPLSFLSHRLSESVKNSPIGPLDRAMGIAFGVVRGLAAVALLYLAYTYFVPVREQATFVRGAQTLPMIQATGEVILSLVPGQSRQNFPAEQPAKAPDPIGELIRGGGNSAPPARSSTGSYGEREPPPATVPPPQGSPARNAERGYGATDRRALDSLIQSSGGNGR